MTTDDRDALHAIAEHHFGGRGAGDVYEPWRPQIGDIVRVHVSPECRSCSPLHERKAEGCVGRVWCDDRFGIVRRVGGRFATHWYGVSVDLPDGGNIGARYAAIELSPLTPASDPAAGAQGGDDGEGEG